MFKFFRKPFIKAVLRSKTNEVKIDVKYASSHDLFIILFSMIRKVASLLKMDFRQLVNKIIEVDKSIIRQKKIAEKENKYQK